MRAREDRAAAGGRRVGEGVGDSAVVARGGGPLASVRWRRELVEMDGLWGGHCAVRDTWRKRRLVRGSEILYTPLLYSDSQIFVGESSNHNERSVIKASYIPGSAALETSPEERQRCGRKAGRGYVLVLSPVMAT